MRVFLCLMTAFFCATGAFGQTGGTVTGQVKGQDEKARPPVGTSVYLLRAKDSATVKITLLQKDGSYLFESIPFGKYLVSATSVGYSRRFSTPFEIQDQQQHATVAALELVPAPKSLSGVTVTATRPLIEQRIDRTIVNVDASITNIGTSALEVLEKSPGVSVDREGNISLKGKEGVLVMVDGRLTQLGGADLANLLRNMNSSQLDQIEIMTNPPARYDAAGTSGIINIKTKKAVSAGYNGSATLGFTQGRYPKANEGINLNYRKGKVNVFTNLSHNYHKGFGTLKFNRNIFTPGTDAVDKVFDQRADRVSEGNALNAKVGLDFFATKKTTWGVVFNGNSRKMTSHNANTTNISSASKVLERRTRAVVDNESDWNSFNANLNFRTVLDKKGREITSDVDYLRYNSGNEQFMVNAYADEAGNPYQKAD
ncbi:MAG TPA: TonB-dependent receptor, partial [Chitinophagaceae bacterium]|nr:TonB-dependent receptor [Chitinophagaceae bacterium]